MRPTTFKVRGIHHDAAAGYLTHLLSGPTPPASKSSDAEAEREPTKILMFGLKKRTVCADVGYHVGTHGVSGPVPVRKTVVEGQARYKVPLTRCVDAILGTKDSSTRGTSTTS